MGTHALSLERCGRVEPFWVRLGWVQWAGSPAREPLMNIEYRRCTNVGARVERNGFVGHFCWEHGGLNG